MISNCSQDRDFTTLGTLEPIDLTKEKNCRRTRINVLSVDASHRSPPKTKKYKKKLKVKKIIFKENKPQSVCQIYNNSVEHLKETSTILPPLKKIPKEKRSSAMKLNIQERIRFISPEPKA